MRLRILLHGGSPSCRQPPDWSIRLSDGRWSPLDVSGRWPMREPWWTAPRAREPAVGGAIHILVAWGGEGDLPSGPAEVAGVLVARLMAGYNAIAPMSHHAQGRAHTPAGLASDRPPPCDCPPWEWGQLAEDTRAAMAAEIRAPWDARRRWLYDGLGGGGG